MGVEVPICTRGFVFFSFQFRLCFLAHFEAVLFSASTLGLPCLLGELTLYSFHPLVISFALESLPGLGRSPGEENGLSLQYSCLENAMDRNLVATVNGVAKQWDTT